MDTVLEIRVCAMLDGPVTTAAWSSVIQGMVSKVVLGNTDLIISIVFFLIYQSNIVIFQL